MNKYLSLVAGALLAFAAAAAVGQQQEDPRIKELRALGWRHGPESVALGGKATVALPADAAALSEGDTDKFMRLTGNLPTPGRSVIAGGNWWAVFDFVDSGHINDDEKLDPDALLKQLQAQDERSNEERRRQGLPELFTDAWFVPPVYNPQTHNLEWGVRLHASDDPNPVVNYTVRVLGRTGYERVILVSTPQTLQRDVAQFRQVLAAFDFDPGEKYSEFRPGDRVAEYGLAALVAGGAAAVATKTGFWKVLLGFVAAGWKMIAALVAATFASIGKLFGKKKEPTA